MRGSGLPVSIPSNRPMVLRRSVGSVELEITGHKKVEADLRQAKEAAEAASRGQGEFPGQHEPRDPHAR